MTGRDIVSAIKSALEADSQLDDWCRATFDVGLTVTVGWAKDGVPADDWAYPCCNLALWKLAESEGGRMAELELDIEAAVYVDTTTWPVAVTARDEGALLADDLLCLCRDAIARAQVGTELSAETIGGMTEDAPRYTARGSITINRLRSHRAGLGR